VSIGGRFWLKIAVGIICLVLSWKCVIELGSLLTGWLKFFLVIRYVSLGESLLTNWLKYFSVVRCVSLGGSLLTSLLNLSFVV
jgi:hypothetical protein